MNRPNLIYVMADQLGYHHVGYSGNPQAKTPNSDPLAGESVNFCSAVSNTPVCAAYRASLFTGKHTTSTGMVINELRMNPRVVPTGWDGTAFGLLTEPLFQSGNPQNLLFVSFHLRFG